MENVKTVKGWFKNAFSYFQDKEPLKSNLLTKEISSSESTSYLTGKLPRYNPDEVVGKKGLQIYKAMKMDDQVKACLSIKKFARLSTPWAIKAGDENDKMAIEMAEFITYTLKNMKGTFERDLLDILTAIEYGFCLHGDTIVHSPSGDKKIKDLEGKEVWVYAFDTKTQEVKVVKSKKVVKTGTDRETVKITYAWWAGAAGCKTNTLICTPEHPILLKSGVYKQAGKLLEGDKIEPLCFVKGRYSNNKAGICHTKLKTTLGKRNGSHKGKLAKWEKEYRFVYEQVHNCKIPKGFDIHHIDGNKLNNSPDNLTMLSSHLHQSLHSKKAWAKLSKEQRTDRALNRKPSLTRGATVSLRNKETWANPEVRQRRIDGIKKSFKSKVKDKIMEGNRKYWERVKGQCGKDNHIVLKVEKDKKADVYDMEVPVYHNFAANDIFVHNSVTEKVYHIYKSGPFAGKIGLKKLGNREPFGYNFVTDSHNNVIGLTFDGMGEDSNGYGTPEKPFPPDKFVIYSYNSEHGNPYGTSDIKSAYEPWFGKKYTIRWWNIFNERFGAPTVVFTYPNKGIGLDKAAIQEIDDILNSLQAKSGFRIPEGVKAELLEATRRGEGGYETAIDKYDLMIARSCLIPNKLGFNDTQGGSYALGKNHFDMFMFVLEMLGKDIEEDIVNEQIIRPLIQMNYGDVDEEMMPYFEFESLLDEDTESRSKVVQMMVNAGIIDKREDWVREYLAIPQRDLEKYPHKTPIGEVEEPAVEAPAFPTEEKPNEPTDKPVDEVDVEDEDDVPVEEEKRKFELSRQPTKFEKKVDFEAMDKGLNTINSYLKRDLQVVVKKWKKDIIKKSEKILSDNDLQAVNKLKLRDLSSFKNTLRDYMIKIHLDSKLKGLEEAQEAKVPVTIKRKFGLLSFANQPFEPWEPLPPTEAVNYFNRKVITKVYIDGSTKLFQLAKMKELSYYDKKAFTVTGVESEYILKEVKFNLLTGLKNGTPKETMSSIGKVFDKYIDTGEIKDGNLLKPSRIETIVRTNSTEALNEGRAKMFTDPDIDDFIPYIQWSSIMDGRTSSYCSNMDGKIFKKGDVLTPPAHYNCFVPTTKVICEKGSYKRKSKQIQNIEVGQSVLTQTGVFNKVVHKFERDYDGELIRIETENGSVLNVTSNHPIFTTNRGWVNAGELESNDILMKVNKRVDYKFHEKLIALRNSDIIKKYILGKSLRKLREDYKLGIVLLKELLRQNEIKMRIGSDAVKMQWRDNPERKKAIGKTFKDYKELDSYVHPRLGTKDIKASKRMKDNNPMFHKKNVDKMRNSLKGVSAGKNNPMYGRSPGHGKWFSVDTPLQGVKRMRSSYEKIYAEYLTENKIDFLYEPKRFHFSNETSYLPDFYLIKDEMYVEVKGWVKDKDIQKLNRFKKEYPEFNIKMITSENIKEILDGRKNKKYQQV